MNTAEIQILKEAVREAVRYTLGQELTAAPSLFPIRTAKQVANIFNVSPFTVKDWHKKRLLRGRYQVLSGRSCRFVFSNDELIRFFDANFPSAEDIRDHPSNPRRGSKSARLIEKMFRMNRLYARQRQPRERDERE